RPSGTADGPRPDASHFRVRRIDRRVHYHRSRSRRPDARCRHGARAVSEGARALRERSGSAGFARHSPPAPTRPRRRGHGQRQLGARAGRAAAALPRSADDRNADTRGDFRCHTSATRSGRMIRTTVVSPALSKEIRALVPLWGATVSAIAAAFVWRVGVLPDAGVLAYAPGTIAIGAHSIGQGD